ncbi:MarR family winged helix-turn-helix transcriptional regulator [Anaerosphaera multitolerans]|uniref:MarR family winged helix-turn-helix transcriptional regulator n=1 Tax=Anaerosphaera multitolerans TaxID=2487351 RepID=UPI00196A2292|nr:MarR family transcriptional regulator [Anaerosphaera multitolerans]
MTTSQHKVFNIVKERLSEFDVTPVQYGVLQCIWQFDIDSPNEVANFLDIENSTISGILERMEKKDLIIREIDVNDRRFIKIKLTDKSKALEEPINIAAEEVNEKILSMFTKEEERDLKKYLRRICTL